MRLFTAIEIPAEIKSQIREFRRNIFGLRWVSDDQLHLTINFIGETCMENFLELKDALSQIKWSAFTLKIDGGGFFPIRGKPSVLWLGLDCPHELVRIKKESDKILQNMGLAVEKRDFHPHLTIARLSKDFPAAKYPFHKIIDRPYSVNFEVSKFHLFSSILDSKGAIHKIEASYKCEQ